ncbi:MAG: D-sedoheptulose 7-phosphate isomerase [Candidatus Omnitrophota bacterium]
MENKIRNIINEGCGVKKSLADQAALIQAMADTIIDSLKKGGKLIVFGNGGSAADSQHFAAELVGRFVKEKKPLPAISLSSNVSTLTALVNDYGGKEVFSKQLEALGENGDIAFAISTSGNSANVIHALAAARQKGLKTVGLSGKGGGELAKAADMCLVVPSNTTARIQEAHITVIHILCELIEDAFTE